MSCQYAPPPRGSEDGGMPEIRGGKFAIISISQVSSQNILNMRRAGYLCLPIVNDIAAVPHTGLACRSMSGKCGGLLAG